MRSTRAVMGHPPMAHERVEGVWGNREVPPHKTEGGHVGETWFPPRERAEGERRSSRLREVDRGLERRELAQAFLVLGPRVAVGDDARARLQQRVPLVQHDGADRDARV